MHRTHDHWGELVPALLAAGRSLICINHRGVYRTARPEPGCSIADLADDQAAALEVLGIDEPVDAYGISMGGMTAIEFAIRHPDQTRTLALGCTPAGAALMTQPDLADIRMLFEVQQSGDRERALRAGFQTNVEQPARTVELLEELSRRNSDGSASITA